MAPLEALTCSFLFGLVHGILEGEHTWPITFSYAIGGASGKEGMKAKLYSSALREVTRMEIPVNADVVCADGPCGRSTYVIINPATWQVTHLMVKEKGFPMSNDWCRWSRWGEADPGHVRLQCTREELAAMDQFIEVEFLPGSVPFVSYGEDEYITVVQDIFIPGRDYHDKFVSKIDLHIFLRMFWRACKQFGRVGFWSNWNHGSLRR